MVSENPAVKDENLLQVVWENHLEVSQKSQITAVESSRIISSVAVVHCSIETLRTSSQHFGNLKVFVPVVKMTGTHQLWVCPRDSFLEISVFVKLLHLELPQTWVSKSPIASLTLKSRCCSPIWRWIQFFPANTTLFLSLWPRCLYPQTGPISPTVEGGQCRWFFIDRQLLLMLPLGGGSDLSFSGKVESGPTVRGGPGARVEGGPGGAPNHDIICFAMDGASGAACARGARGACGAGASRLATSPNAWSPCRNGGPGNSFSGCW